MRHYAISAFKSKGYLDILVLPAVKSTSTDFHHVNMVLKLGVIVQFFFAMWSTSERDEKL